MRNVIGLLIVFLLVSFTIFVPVAAKLTHHKDKLTGSYTAPESAVVPADAAHPVINAYTEDYVFVGGQNGTWFEQGQAPRAYQIYSKTQDLAF